jgi:hypothetical protein
LSFFAWCELVSSLHPGPLMLDLPTIWRQCSLFRPTATTSLESTTTPTAAQYGSAEDTTSNILHLTTQHSALRAAPLRVPHPGPHLISRRRIQRRSGTRLVAFTDQLLNMVRCLHHAGCPARYDIGSSLLPETSQCLRYVRRGIDNGALLVCWVYCNGQLDPNRSHMHWY